MNKFESNGVAINYRSVGDGSDVVLIHGLATNHAFWRFDVLRQLALDHRVTVYDLRGHGYSSMPSSGYTSLDMVVDLDGLLDHLNVSRAHLVGHSYGGVVALHYAVRNPHRVASLTIADSRVRSLQPLQRLRDWPEWEKTKEKLDSMGIHIDEDMNDVGFYILEKAASPGLRRKLKDGQFSMLFNGVGKRVHSAERWLELLNTTTARDDLTSMAGLTLEALSSIEVPTFVIYGEKSTLLQSLNGLEKNLRRCETAIVPDAGHFFPMTRPKFFVTKVSEFLAAVEMNKHHVVSGTDRTGTEL